MKKIIIIFFFAGFSISVMRRAYPEVPITPLIPPGSHCVAYIVKKKVFFLVSSTVSGLNCQIYPKIIRAANGKFLVEVKVPITGFDTGNSKRDTHVAEILGMPKQPNLIYKSEAHSKPMWQKILKTKKGFLNGKLKLNEKNFSIKSLIAIKKLKNGYEISGIIKSRLTQFGIKPPKAGIGGIFADTGDYIEIHFMVQTKKIADFQLIEEN